VNEIIADFAAEIGYPAIGGRKELNVVEIYLAERGRLRRIIAGMGLTAADIEDVLQDVSVKALRKSVRLQTRQSCLKWLIQVTINECLSEHRRRRIFRRNAGEILRRRSEKKIFPADKKIISAEELEIMRDNLKKLDKDLLGPIILKYFCGMNSNEISEILGQNPSTVRGRLRDARMILAKSLLERGVEP